MAGSEIPSQLGKTAVVTGATGGLGYETALALAKAGSEVILTGRDDQKGRSALEKIRREVTGVRATYERLDLASLASVVDFAQRMHARHSLDLLINNAGVMALPRRQATADGFEMQFGTNHLGHFALTARLMPLLRRASGARVVSLSSLAHRTGLIDFIEARLFDVRARTATAERCGRLEPDQQRGPSGICPNQPVHERSGRSCFSCERFRGSIVRSFRGGRRPADPVRGNEPGGKAGRLLRARRI